MTDHRTPPTDDAGADRLLDDAIAAARIGPTPEETRRARDRARAALFGDAAAAEPLAEPCASLRPELAALIAGSLSPDRAALVEDHCGECVPCRRERLSLMQGRASSPEPAAAVAKARRWPGPILAMAAVVALAAIVTALIPRPSATATVAEIEGSLLLRGEALSAGDVVPAGEPIRTAKGSRAVLTLPDGSRMEMNERAQASFVADRRELAVLLDRGDVIIDAAHRPERNLFVRTGDCTVAVKGTVFTVRRSLKGSRVGVLEGSVHVDGGGNLSVLGPGEQVATDPMLAPQPLGEQVGWSLDAARYDALLREIAAAAASVEASSRSLPPRHQSAILDAMPDSTVFFAAVPNDGDLARLADEISDRVASNPQLAAWWQAELDRGTDGVAVVLQTLGRLSDALGDEAVLALIETGPARDRIMPVLVAGLRDEAALRQLVSDLAPADRQPRILSAGDVAARGAAAGSHEPLLVVHAGHVLAGPSAEAIGEILHGLDNGAPHGTPFLANLDGRYDRGAEFLIAADLGRVVARRATEAAQRAATSGEPLPRRILEGMGIQGVDQFVLTAGRQDPGTALISFREERTGAAAWLAPPGPMGSLAFITPECTFAVATLFADPERMLGDIERVMPEGNLERMLSSLFDETGINLRDDIAASLGGEAALAMDGPLLPLPSWKLILEVDDAPRLEKALERIATLAADAMREEGVAPTDPPLTRLSTAEGDTRLLALGSTRVHYAIRNGYFVACPSAVLLQAALQAHARGTSLATSPTLVKLLPGGQRDGLSMLAWQDASRLIGPLRDLAGTGALPAGTGPFLAAADGPALAWARASDRSITMGVNGLDGGLGGGLAALVRRHVTDELARRALTGATARGEDARTAVQPE